MFKRRGVFLVFVSLVMGIAAAWAANNWVQSRLGPSGDQAVETDTVVAAAMDIPYGTEIEARHVKVMTLPRGTAPENAIRETAQIEGMVATTDVLSGEILMKDRFAEHGAGSTLAALIEKGMRAVTVRVDDVVGVGGFLLPGNRVDVLASRLDSRTRRAQTETILKNLKVLAVDQTAQTERNDPVVVRAVTLEMTPAQSEKLVKAKAEGTIQLALRNPLAEEEQEVAVEEPPAPKPAPKPVVRRAPVRRSPPSTTITVIRGTTVDTEKSKG
jgi:pilus assembly protein CpaB